MKTDRIILEHTEPCIAGVAQCAPDAAISGMGMVNYQALDLAGSWVDSAGRLFADGTNPALYLDQRVVFSGGQAVFLLKPIVSFGSSAFWGGTKGFGNGAGTGAAAASPGFVPAFSHDKVEIFERKREFAVATPLLCGWWFGGILDLAKFFRSAVAAIAALATNAGSFAVVVLSKIVSGFRLVARLANGKMALHHKYSLWCRATAVYGSAWPFR